MIDIKLVRDNPKLVEKNCDNRGYDVDVDGILKIDEKWKKIKFEADQLRKDRNSISKNISQAKLKEQQDFLKKNLLTFCIFPWVLYQR